MNTLIADKEVSLAELSSVAQTDASHKIRTNQGLESQLAYVRQTKADHGYSKAIARLFDLVMSYIDDAEKAARNGRKAVWMAGGAWSPLYYAADTIPISINELGRLGSSDAMFVAEDYFQLPKESCSMVGAVLGEFYLRLGRTVKRMAVYNAQCEPLNLAWELLRDEGFDIFRVEAINRPNTADTKDRLDGLEAFLEQELKDLNQWLVDRPIDEDRLRVEIQRTNRILRKVRRIMSLRIENPLYIRSLASMYLLIGSAHYFGKPDEYENVLDTLIDELEHSPLIPLPRGKIVPLAWSGGRGQEFGVYKAIDDSGGAILSWHTPDPWLTDIDESLPPLKGYVRHIVSGRRGGSQQERLEQIERSLAKYGGVKGILSYGYVGCSRGGSGREYQRIYFQKRNIPSIALEGTFQVGPPSGQLLTRVRAFIEMLS
ncbi:MAG: 2-hydroxyacyl-CoA dehydratase family protein [Opitutaceae bacterium]|jgi:benzoyl-CoA reductase/2-hydroxyglutaryl-CoA dehydratase subunit BcrC/BadD/HgdB